MGTYSHFSLQCKLSLQEVKKRPANIYWQVKIRIEYNLR